MKRFDVSQNLLDNARGMAYSDPEERHPHASPDHLIDLPGGYSVGDSRKTKKNPHRALSPIKIPLS